MEQIQNINEKINDEIKKLESKINFYLIKLVSCKALWDSFTLFTSTLNQYDFNV